MPMPDALQKSPSRPRAEIAAELLAELPPETRRQVQGRLDDVPPTFRVAYLRAIGGKSSLKQAARMNCYHCMGWDRQEVPLCTSPTCPMYMHRPKK